MDTMDNGGLNKRFNGGSIMDLMEDLISLLE